MTTILQSIILGILQGLTEFIPISSSAHLVIVPHSFLHYLPFHALFDGSQYLLDSYLISYAPSAGVYALSRQAQVNSSGSSLVLGIPDEQAPFIREEVECVASGGRICRYRVSLD